MRPFIIPMSMMQQMPGLDQHVVLAAAPGAPPAFVTTATSLPVAMRTEPPSIVPAPMSMPLPVVVEPVRQLTPKVELYCCNVGQMEKGEIHSLLDSSIAL